MVTNPLPRLIQTTIDTALTIAVRRWPSYLRDELAQEWAAELHVLAHQRASLATRAWRSLGFTVSLMFARGIEKPEPTTGRYPMRTLSRPILGLALTPVLMALAVMATYIVVTVLQETLLDPVISFSGPLWILQDLGSPMAVVTAVSLGLLGLRRGRRSPLPFPHPTASTAATVACLAAGMLAIIALNAPLGSSFGDGEYKMELVGLFTWAPLLALSIVAVRRLPRPWDLTAAGVGVPVCWYLALLAAVAVAPYRAPEPLLTPLYVVLGDT